MNQNKKKLKRVYLEISNICNLSCDFCNKHHRVPQMMTLEQISNALDQIKEVTDYVYLHVKGEPMLHPDFIKILHLCQDKNLQVQLVSNASLLNRYPDLINEASLRKVSFSLHSIPFQKTEIQEYMKPVLDFAKKASENKHPYVELRFWNKDNLDEKSKACLAMIYNIHPLTETTRPGSYRWLDQVYVHFDSQFEWPASAHAQDTAGTCQGCRTMIGILADGTVVPCCLDDEGIINLGNLFEIPLTSILESERFLAIQKGFNQRKVIEPLCQQCTYRHRFD